MPLRDPYRSLLLGLIVLMPVAPLALLCRGHTPSRLDATNLPFWERRPPHEIASRAPYVFTPLPPGSVVIADHSQRESLLHTNENKLLAGAEQSYRGDAGTAGLWLESACAWGNAYRPLRDKQDRVAARLMSVQTEDGFLGVRPTSGVWTLRETRAQAACLRGLVAYYDLTERPAAIFAAMSAADRLLSEHPSDPCLILPFAHLYQATGDERYLAGARWQARVGGNDGWGQCALYEATGQAEYLQAARRLWTQETDTPALSAELLLLTGRPAYADALSHEKTPGPELQRVAWTRIRHGFALSTARNCGLTLPGLRLTQQTLPGKVRVVTIGMTKPTTLTLEILLPSGPAVAVRVNGALQKNSTLPDRYFALTRRWRSRDMVTLSTPKSPALKGRAI